MEINIIQKDNALTVSLSGRLDTVTSKDLLEQLPLEKRQNMNVTFDFANLEYLSSAGLRALIVFKKDAQATNNVVEIINANQMVKEIFRTTGFEKLLNVK